MLRALASGNRTVDYFGRRAASGKAIGLDDILISDASGMLVRYRLQTDGRPVRMFVRDGTGMELSWISATKAAVIVRSRDGQSQLNTVVDFANPPARTDRSPLARPNAAGGPRRRSNARPKSSEESRPSSPQLDTTGQRLGYVTAGSSVNVRVTECMAPATVGYDVSVNVNDATGRLLGVFPATFVGNGVFTASVPTSIAPTLNPSEICQFIAEVLDYACTLMEAAPSAPLIICAALTAAVLAALLSICDRKQRPPDISSSMSNWSGRSTARPMVTGGLALDRAHGAHEFRTTEDAHAGLAAGQAVRQPRARASHAVRFRYLPRPVLSHLDEEDVMPRLRTFRVAVTFLGVAGSALPANSLAAQSGHRITACAVREAPDGQNLAANPTLAVMFTAIGGGQVLRQSETTFQSGLGRACAYLKDLPPGSYDIRVEAAGMRTEVKRGARLFADQDSDLSFVLNPGSGVRIVEYAQGGLAREEVATRLAALESALAKIQAASGATSTAAKP